MAQFISRRRMLASSDTNPPPRTPSDSSSSSVPTITRSKTLDPKNLFLMSSDFPRLNPRRHDVPKPTTKDIYMQAKSMTLSADSASLFKPKPRNIVKGEKFLPKQQSFPERKPSKDLDGKKQQKEKVGLTKKELLGAVTATKDSQGEVLELEASRISVSSSSLLGRRRSLDGSSSRVKLADVLANCGVRIVSVDMPPFMQIHAVDFARKTHDSLEKFSPKSLALSLKKEFDGVYGPAWHCIVGTSFGSFVTHSVGGFLYFSMDQKLYFLLFKTAVQRAD